MNISLYSHYFMPEVSAPSIRLHDMARVWIRQGHRVQVATCFPNHPSGRLYPGYRKALYKHEVMDGIDVHRHWTFITPNRGLALKSLGHLSYLPSALLISNARIKRPDVAIGSSPTFLAAAAAARTARSHRVPFVMEVRDLWPAVFTQLGVVRNRRLVNWLEKIELGLYAQAARVVTLTDSFRQDLLSRNVPSDKVVTIPNGADLVFWSPRQAPHELRQRLGLEGAFVVLYIGTHGISHGLDAILSTARQLRDCSDIRFLFVGDGAEKPSLVETARRTQLENVRFLDSVGKEEVRDFYALADVCLLPLRSIKLFEGFIPSKMFEMMAMGRPILGSVSGETASILLRSGAATVVEPQDSDQIARALLDLRANPARRSEMGAAGRRYVGQHYDRERLAAVYGRVLEEAVQEASRH